MRRFLVSLGLGLVVAVSMAPAAEENKPAAVESSPAAARLVERRMEVMKERLKLTPEQAEKIRAIMLRDMEKFQQLRGDSSLSREDRNNKMREVLRESTVELQAVLTPEQKEIWKAEAAKERKADQERRAEPGNAAPQEKK